MTAEDLIVTVYWDGYPTGHQVFEFFDLKTNLQEVRDEMKGDVFLYHHDGPQLCYNEDDTTLGDIFGEDVCEIDLDCIEAQQGPKVIRNKGQTSIQVLDHERIMKKIGGNDEKSVTLPTKRARNKVNDGRNVLRLVEEHLRGENAFLVREYCIDRDEGAVTINSDLSAEIDGNILDKGIATLSKYERGSEDDDEEKVHLSKTPALPEATAEPDWTRNGITRVMVARSQELCNKAYEAPENPEHDIEGTDTFSADYREIKTNMGGTVTILRHYAKTSTLHIAFRGSEDLEDWLSNFCVEEGLRDLGIGLKDMDGWAEVRFHKGFAVRAEMIINQLVMKIGEFGQPRTIIVSGHSLAGAISQIVYIMLHKKLDAPLPKLINITFATPLMGNMKLRARLMEGSGFPKSLIENMHHYVVQGDVVPALMFTHVLYENLPYYDWMIRATLWALRKITRIVPARAVSEDTSEDVRNRATTTKEFLVEMRNEPQTVLNTFVPIGNYTLVTEYNQWYEFPFEQDPAYVAQVLTPTLEAIGKISIPGEVLRQLPLFNKIETTGKQLLDAHDIKKCGVKMGLSDDRS